MELLDYLRRQFTYDNWANREVLTRMQAIGGESDRPRQLLAHILSAERLWLERIRKQPQSLPVWPDFTYDQCDTQISALGNSWSEFLAQLTAAKLGDQFTYKNSKGEPFASTIQDILTHVLLHSAYHRGQIAGQVRAAGNTPAYTDFIHAVRQGLIE
jgi:uncharacterized damage-inducible protein DinB